MYYLHLQNKDYTKAESSKRQTGLHGAIFCVPQDKTLFKIGSENQKAFMFSLRSEGAIIIRPTASTTYSWTV
jgi:hypothetical protein